MKRKRLFNRSSNDLRLRFCCSLVACVALNLSLGASNAADVAVAGWITDSEAVMADDSQAPIALQFRRDILLSIPPKSFRVRISADNRFVLFVNNQRVSEGPARGNLAHWRFESVDLAPYLRSGENIVAVRVWSDAQAAPLAQISSGHTGLWVQAEERDQRHLIDSGPAWLVRVDRARTVERGMPQVINAVGPTFYAAGPPESFDAAKSSSDWTEFHASAKDWRPAAPVDERYSNRWTLVADTLPAARYERVPAGRAVRAHGVAARQFPEKSATVAPQTTATILIDAGRLLAAYPRLRLSGGAGAHVQMTYVESLYDPNAKPADPPAPAHARFADRSTVKNGVALGLTDHYTSDGSAQQRFEPFWWRAWRFVEIKVHTAAEPLTLESFETWETGYPFVERGRFVSDDAELNAIWRIGWHTALLDAHETYMDTAYWEQLQYIGDSRIQMLLSYEVTGDTRLAIQALDAFDQSRVVAGMPQSAWPGVMDQVIPPFALLWIGALHDYWMWEPDTGILTRTLPGTRAVLDEFAKYVLPSGLVGPMPGWPFVDWKPGLDGWAYRDKGLLSCVISMQYIGALREAADLESAVGESARAERYAKRAEQSTSAVNGQCWDEKRQLYADTPAKQQFSQHGAALAALYDIAPQDRQQALLKSVMLIGKGMRAPKGITPTSYYFSFYLARALQHAGLAERYFDFLKPWREMRRRNFTTWPETPDPSRSDSHAWSSHPTTGLLEYVAGIGPSAPGFARVLIEPHLGPLKSLDAAMAHPNGLIETHYERHNTRLSVRVTLPEKLSGEFRWQGHTYALSPGGNELTMP